VIRAPVDSIHRESSGLAELGVSLWSGRSGVRDGILLGPVSDDDALRKADQLQRERNQTAQDAAHADLEFSSLQSKKLASSIRSFLQAMAAQGNPGLERRPTRDSPASGPGTIRPNGTVTSSGRDWLPAEQWAEQTLARPGRDGPMPGNAGWRRSVDAQVKGLTEHLARILDRHGVDLP
jgi:hypothetical protein